MAGKDSGKDSHIAQARFRLPGFAVRIGARLGWIALHYFALRTVVNINSYGARAK